ncbi:unnamed protein product, partial [Phaeothamnion confervicola]
MGQANRELNAVNCSASSNCTALGREECSETTGVNLCGRCLDGFFGVNAPANTACLEEAAVCGSGYNCTEALDCEFGACVGGICGSAVKTCDNDCGGRGNCTYIDASGTYMAATDCTIDRLLCYAVCSCNDGFNGSAC